MPDKEAVMEKELEKQEITTKEILAKEKKVPIFIPEDPLNPDDVVPVGINGVIYAIPRGQQFMVPESIYKVWKNSYDETVKANKRIRITEKKDLEIID
jgi:hypothetical protein